MALSLVSSAHSSYSDLQSFFDNSRLGFDFSNTFHDQMEYNNINLQNSHPHRNFSDGQQNVTSNNVTRVFNDFNDQVINFVDSPPNSKESWSEDQSNGSPRIIDVQTLYSNNGNRKRRMDWDPIEISQNANNTSNPNNNNNRANNNSSPPKIPNISNNSPSTHNTQSSASVEPQLKERSINDNKKKQPNVAGRANWSDDIDFGEFDNSSYLNSEAFLAFNPPLGLKQEIPSPQTPPSKLPNKSPSGHIIDSPDSGQKKGDQQDHTLPVSSPQNKCFEKDGENVSVNASGGTFQQLLPSNISAGETTSVQNSPRPITELSAKGDFPVDDFKFQYILAAATSIATKNNEETLTYLNQGQSYEIKLKKTGDLSFYRDKILRSVIKICFHERRLQYMERAQMQQWQASRPGERIIEVDVPLSYGLCSAFQPTNSNQLNTVEVFWDPMKEVGVYIKVNCISTEFTPKKHGGEKGVPFRIQIETYIENSVGGENNTTGSISNLNNSANNSSNSNLSMNSNNKLAAVHAAACQIKVFKLKGADRKHKQDKEKIQRRPQTEQDKYQPSYECTILNDIPLDTLNSNMGCYSPEYFGKLWPNSNSPVHITKYDGLFSTTATTTNSSPIAINCVTSTNNSNLKIMDCNMVSPPQIEIEETVATISKDSTPSQVAQWLIFHRLNAYVSTFAQYLGSDIFRMSKEDLIQICGLADGIRMYNILHYNQETKRTIYISIDGCNFHAIYMKTANVKELVQKLMKLPGFFEFCANITNNVNGNSDGSVFSWGMHSKYSGSGSNIYDGAKMTIYLSGPSGVHVLVTDEVLVNEIEDKSPYALEVQNGKVLMKLIKKLEN